MILNAVDSIQNVIGGLEARMPVVRLALGGYMGFRLFPGYFFRVPPCPYAQLPRPIRPAAYGLVFCTSIATPTLNITYPNVYYSLTYHNVKV
jgi:hypothetical protein